MTATDPVGSAAGPAAGMEIPRFGFGAAALGDLYERLEETAAEAVVEAAWDDGVRHFDVAPHYGLGLAERRVGRALAGRPREDYLLSTKVGRLLEPSPETADRLDDGFLVPAHHRRVWDASEHGLRRSLAASAERMGVERFDIAYLHDPEENVPPGAALEDVLPGWLGALVRVRDEGLVRAVGVGSKSVTSLLAAVRTGLTDVVMLAGRYTLLERTAATVLLDACLAAGVRVVAGGVFNSGALAEDVPRPGLPYEYGPMPAAVLERVSGLAALCRRHGTTLPVAALHFPLRHPAVAGVVIGAGSAEQQHQNAARWRAPVPDALWAELDLDAA